MVRNLRKASLWIMTGLTLVNLWMWDWQLPFAGYAENNLHMMALQLIHVILIMSELTILLLMGRRLSRTRFSRFRLLSAWLLMVGVGMLAVIIELLWKRQFQFSDLLSALMPISRNAMPLATAILLGMLIIPALAKLSVSTQRRGLLAILGLLFLATLYNQDLWGLGSGQNVAFGLLMLSLGAFSTSLPKFSQRSKRLGGVVLVVITLLAMVMPKISMTVHDDMSTASRLASLTNVFLIAVALMGVDWFDDQDFRVTPRDGWPIFGSLLAATQPLFYQHLVGLAAGHFNNLVLKIGLLIGLAMMVMLVGTAMAWLIRRLKNLRGGRWLQHWVTTLPTTPAAWLPWTRQFVKRHWSGLVLIAFSYALALLSFLLMNSSWQLSPNTSLTYNTLLYTFFVRQSMVLLTTLLLILVIKTLQALINRYWTALGIVLALMVVIIIANRIKIAARNEPILPSELRMYRAFGSLFKMVNGSVWVGALIGLLVLIVVVIYLEKRYPVAKLNWRSRIIWWCLTVIVFGSSARWNHQNSYSHAVMAGMGDQAMFYNQLSGARINGPVIQFMNNLDVKVMDKPAGYSKAAMEKIARRYQQTAQRINRQRTNDLSKQNIVFNLSESFADPRRVPGVTLAQDPMPNIEKLKRNNTGGLMISSGYGGGTANMEYMTLTGLALCNFSPTLPTPYTQLVPFLSKAWSINQVFKDSTAIHPYVGVFYSRTTVYQKFGFNRFMYLGSKYKIKHQYKIGRSNYLSDQTAYANTLDQLKKHRQGEFINLVTMQNHFPYNKHFYDHADRYAATAKDGTSTEQVEQFAMGVHYTDQAVAKFIKQLDQLSQPVTVVFYGDHLPGIYQNNMAKDGLKLHETDYFIYSNRAARKQGARNLTKQTGYVAPNDFIAMVAAQTNSKVSPYLALLTEVWQKLPAVALDTSQSSTNTYNSSAQFINQHGKVTKLTRQQKKLWHDYQLVQYDLTTGKQYLYKTNMLK